MKKVTVVRYDMKGRPMEHRTALQRDLNGFNDHSNNSSHIYKREGVLTHLPKKRLNNGVLLINTIDCKKVLSILKKHRANVTVIHLFSKKAV